MKIPSSTYRIQFRNGMTFDRAARLVPYLKRLGISHLYASPIFTATEGSTHGYDVTDSNELDPSLGGRKGFERLSDALRSSGLGLIVDIVPNHMAASLENPWWRDVLEHGQQSRFSRYFDIDWSRRLTLPNLGDDFDVALKNGEISIAADPKHGTPAIAYFDSYYPLTPSSYAGREAEILRMSDPQQIATLHDQQPYRLISWRDAPTDLSYRRFFEVTGLVGLRVEDGAVFDDAHRTILDLVRSGRVDGLRLDHVDGLADPKAYLERLRQEAGPDTYIVVEKILGEGEQLPQDWPISGSTGYEFIAALSNVFIDGEKAETLTATYDDVLGKPVDLKAELRAAKLLMTTRNFAGEVSRLLQIAMQLQRGENWETPISETNIGNALRELLIAFPVYRTYGTTSGIPIAGRTLLEEVLKSLRSGEQGVAPDPDALAFLERILVGDVDVAMAAKAAAFRVRFQQLTGPLMAKSIEDTLFFRQHRLLSLNEVGSEPLPHPSSVERFHAEMELRLQTQPNGLSATSTHDTKRGEDARARLYAVSEAPDLWAQAVQNWRTMNNHAVTTLPDGPAPEPEVEWMLYQSLLGCWPADLEPDDTEKLGELETRFLAYVEKALREAKLRTGWTDPNEAYEKAVAEYARHLLSAQAADFRRDFLATAAPFMRSGLANGVTQTLTKLMAPGIPDIYQGSEVLDLSLVDPDNRREPDFAKLENQLAEQESLPSTEEDWTSGRLKQHILAAGLRFRRNNPQLFQEGKYTPIEIRGDRQRHVLSFARSIENQAAIVIAPRLAFDAFRDTVPKSLPEKWKQTRIRIPEQFAGRRFRDIFSDTIFELEDTLALSTVFSKHPFAILITDAR